jgi:flagellar basal body rod protein FlgG
MAQYGIGLSALNAFSEAIDVTSNNIANAQTVGYKQVILSLLINFLKLKTHKVVTVPVWVHRA